MNYIKNKQLDILIALAYPLKGNAYIYNYILKTVDAIVEIPPPTGKGQILDLICKIFTEPQYENEKNKISDIVIKLGGSKGTAIIKTIQLIALFRPNNTSLITPMYTTLSNKLSYIPQEYLDSFIDNIGKMQEKISYIEYLIDPEKIIGLIKNLVMKYKNRGGKKSRKSNKSKKTRSSKSKKSKKTRRNK